MPEMIHSRFGGSRIHFLVKGCLGFNNATRDYELTPDITLNGKSADEGNAMHDAAEFCLRMGFMAKDIIGRTFNGFAVDELAAEHIQIYLDRIKHLKLTNPNCKSLVEEKIYMSSVANDIWSYADHILIAGDTLYIDDFKYGFILTDAIEQCAHYAVSVCDTYNLWFKIKKVVCTVTQPRADHMQGSIRTFEYTIDEIMGWRDTFAYVIGESRKPDAPRKAGEHCRFCPARENCRTRILHTLNLTLFDTPIEDINDDQIEALLSEIPAILNNIEAVQELSLRLARGGKKFSKFKLVKGIVRAVPTNEAGLVEKLVEKGVDKDKLYNPGKLKGKTKLKPLLLEHKLNPEDYWETPTAETKLVPLTHTSAAVQRTAAGVFPPIKRIEK